MILYHFTSKARLPAIKERGLIKGDVPISRTAGFNAVWLTANEESNEQEWSEMDSLPVTRGRTILARTDKTAVRISVEINQNDPKLRKWSTYARAAGVDEEWYKILDKTGNNDSENWYIYLGRIAPSKFKEIRIDDD